VAVFTVGGGTPTIGGGRPELLQHHPHRGREGRREIWAENPRKRSSPRGCDSGNGGPASSEE
jgi:hypothetical protein